MMIIHFVVKFIGAEIYIFGTNTRWIKYTVELKLLHTTIFETDLNYIMMLLRLQYYMAYYSLHPMTSGIISFILSVYYG